MDFLKTTIQRYENYVSYCESNINKWYDYIRYASSKEDKKHKQKEQEKYRIEVAIYKDVITDLKEMLSEFELEREEEKSKST